MVNVIEVVVRTFNDTKTGLEAAKKDFDKAGKEISGALKPIGIALGGSGLLAASAPLAAAGVAMGAFGAVAVPVLRNTLTAAQKNQQAQTAYNDAVAKAKQVYQEQMASATSAAQKSAALRTEQNALAAAQLTLSEHTTKLTSAQQQLVSQVGALKSAFTGVQTALTPLIVQVAGMGVKLATDLMPSFKLLATVGGSALQSLLSPIDVLVRSSGFTKFIQDVASFAKQAAPVIGNLLVGAIKILMSLFEQLAPVGMQVLKALQPLLLGVMKSAIPIITTLAKVFADILTPLSRFSGVIAPLTVAFYGLLKVIQLVRGAQLLLDAAMELNPVILITTAIAALAAGFVIAWQKSSLFRDIVKDIAKVMLATGIIVVQVNKQIVDAILTVIGTILHGLKDAFGWIPGGIGNSLKAASSAFDNFHSRTNSVIDGIVGKMRGWESELDASKNKAASTASNVGGSFSRISSAAGSTARGINGIASAIAGLHSKNLSILMNGKGQYSLSEINANTGKQQQAAAGAYVTGGIAGRDSVPILAMPGEVVVPTHMVNSGAVDHLRGRIPGFASGGVVGNLNGGYVTGMYQNFQNKMTAAMVSAMRTSLSAAETAAAKAAASVAAGSPGPGGGAPAANAALARRLYPAWGSGAEWTAWNNVAMRESGWNQYARNPSSGAYGIPQALPPSKMGAAANPPQSNPTAQINWMIGYIKGRYGDPIGAWNHELSSGWYDNGGWLPTGKSVAVNNTGSPEMVVGPRGLKIELEIDSGGQSAFERFMSEFMKNYVRVKGGGSVQKAFGLPGRQ